MVMADNANDVKFVNPLSADDEPSGDNSPRVQKGTGSDGAAVLVSEAAGATSPRNADMDEEMAKKTFLQKFAAFIGPGNVSAGAASALHVNIYLFALGMMLASPYYVRSRLRHSIMRTMLMLSLAVRGCARTS